MSESQEGRNLFEEEKMVGKHLSDPLLIDKVSQLGEEIEHLELSVIATASDTCENNHKTCRNPPPSDKSEVIEKIISEWTVKIINRYADLQKDDAESLILIVIEQTKFNDNANVSLLDTINGKLEKIIATLETVLVKETIWNACLDRYNSTETKADDTTKNETKNPIDENESFLKFSTETRKKYESLSSVQKREIQLHFMKFEFVVFQQLIRLSENEQHDIDQIVHEKNTEQKTQIKNDPNMLFGTKITHLIEKLDFLEYRFNVDLGNYRLMIERLKFFISDSNISSYDKLLTDIDAYLYNQMDISMEADSLESSSSEFLKSILVKDIFNNFCQRYEIFSDFTDGIVDRLKEIYAKDTCDNKSLEEFKFHFENMIDCEKIESKILYKKIAEISQAYKNSEQNVNILIAYLLNTADNMEFLKVADKMVESLSHQDGEKAHISEIKSCIIKNVNNYCGLLDRSAKEGYTSVIRLYLDKLDRLVAENNDEDLSYLKRKETFDGLNSYINEIVENSAISESYKKLKMEKAISLTISKPVFSISCDLLSDILDPLDAVVVTLSKTKHQYKRNALTQNSIDIEKLFHHSGQFRVEAKKELIRRNMTVVAEYNGIKEYYRLTDDLNSLLDNYSNYCQSFAEFETELYSKYMQLKLFKFKQAISEYNANKNIETLISLTKGLVYYFSLQEEHLQLSKHKEMGSVIGKFVENYHSTIKYLLVPNKEDQEIFSELEIAIDSFSQDVLQYNVKAENSYNYGTLNESLKYLKSTLRHKYFKISSFDKTYIEDRIAFSDQFELNNFLHKKLNQFLKKSFPEIIWLRNIFHRGPSSEVFFDQINRKLDALSPENIKTANKDSVKCIQEFIRDEKYSMILGEQMSNNSKIDNFVTKLTTGKITPNDIFSDENITSENGLRALSIIIQENHKSISKENLEKLILLFDKDTNGKEYINEFIINLMKLYSNNLLVEKLSNLKSEMSQVVDKKRTQYILTQLAELDVSLLNAFNVWEIVSGMNNKKPHKLFLDYLEELTDSILSESMQIKNSKQSLLEQKQINFIINILDSENALANKNANNIFSLLETHFGSESSILAYLQLLLQLPNSFYTDRKCYKSFIKTLISQLKNDDSDFLKKLYWLVRAIVARYYDVFLDDMLCEEQFYTRMDIKEAIKRLFPNITISDFVEIVPKLFEREEGIEKTNFMLATFVNLKKDKLIQTIQFLNREEKENLLGILKHYSNLSKQKISEIEEKELSIDKILESMLKSCKLNVKRDLEKIFSFEDDAPIAMWEEELLALRVNNITNLMLHNFANTEDRGTNRLGDIIHAFLDFHRRNMHNMTEALKTLDLICNNIEKFRSLEEIKLTIFALANFEDLESAKNIISCSYNKSIPLELMFSQIDVGDNQKVSNALAKLKIILAHCKFSEISYFTRLFILQTKEGQSYQTLPSIIELIIESKAYTDIEFLEAHIDKNLSQWEKDLEKVKILNEINSTIFAIGTTKTKEKTTELLLQIKEDKGEFFFKTLFNKIKSLPSNENKQRNIHKTLNLFLRKILSKSFSNDAITSLTVNLTNWDEIMFSLHKFKDEELSMQELLEEMKDEGKIDQYGINESITVCIAKDEKNGSESKIEEILKKAQDLNKKSIISSNTTNNISQWQKAEIKEWAIQFSTNSSLHKEIFCWSTRPCNDTLCEVLSVIIQAVILYDHYPRGPRVVQLMALLLFLDCEGKGRLGNIFTGEGKTLITAMLATCLGLTGKIVDIVTSSKVLATRDSKQRDGISKEGYKGFYEMFGLQASNNCDEMCEDPLKGEEERKNRYDICSIVYGDTGCFERDIVLSNFFRKDIRTERNGIGDVLILDEVDSMMIDNAANTLYISHNITDMRYLKDLFIRIWAVVNSRTERYYSEANVQKIIKYINQLINNKQEELNLLIPTTLIDFVQQNLEIWVENAYNAKYMDENDAYIIGDAESQKQNEVIIMDKDTGVEQMYSKWSNGLHQFIELKHSNKLSDESLKAVYISNMGYFQMYPKLYGMTGTVGDVEERSLLSRVYGIDFFELPRFKKYRYEYDDYSEEVAGTREKWVQFILENIQDNMSQSLNLTAEYIETMKKKKKIYHDKLQELQNSEKKYTDMKIELDNEIATRESKVEICTSFESIRKEIHRFCDKPVFERINEITHKWEAKVNSDMSICKKSESHNELCELVRSYKKFLEKLAVCRTKYDIEIFVESFKSQTFDISSCKNKEKSTLVELNAKLSTVEEEVGYIKGFLKTCRNHLDFYEEGSKAKVDDKLRNRRRAVLIICENIANLCYIATKVREKFGGDNVNNTSRYRIFVYDRAYKKFDISCLEAGDIVIATNIAGRGTDLEVTPEVEENGGLHVIMTYMPKNVRIEKQAFGRTARAGNRGTGTFIVLDEKKRNEKLVSISQLKNERNEEEKKRLALLEKEQLPRIKLEDELFIEFNKLQQNVENVLINQYDFKLESKCVEKDPLKLQMESLKNIWAIWLNKMSDQFNKVHETGNFEILTQFKVFQNGIHGKLDGKYKLIEEPGELIKLGRVFVDNEEYSKAVDCFDHVIKKHFWFSSIAHYYKAFCIIRKDGGGFDSKLRAKAVLKTAVKMLEAERERVLSRIQILKTINEFARAQGKGLGSNRFAKQNEGEAHILSKHINAIYSAIGSEITPDHFNAPGISGDQPQKVFDELKKEHYNVIKNFRISKKCVIGCKVLIKDSVKQNEAIQNLSLDNVMEVEQFLKADYVNCNEMVSIMGEDSYTNILKILTDTKIISDANIFKKKSSNDEYIASENIVLFPDKFPYCKNNVLNYFACMLAESKNNNFWHSKRMVEPSSIQKFMYSEAKFLKDADGLIEKKLVVRIAKDIDKKLLGKLDHAVFCSKGKELKMFFNNTFIRIDPKHLQRVFEISIINNDLSFSEKLIEQIKSFCLGLLKNDFSTKPIGNNVYVKNEIANALREIIASAGNQLCIEKKLNVLLTCLKFDNETNVLAKHDLVKALENRISLQEDQVYKILTHLESYTWLFVDHAFLKEKFATTKNEIIFLGKKTEIKEFCTGVREITLSNEKIVKMIDNESIAKDDVVSALKKIVNLSDDNSSRSAKYTSFQALLIHFGFNSGQSFDALDSFTEYSIKDSSHLSKIEDYLQTIIVKDNSPETLEKIEKLDFSFDSRLGKETTEIIKTLKQFANKPLKKEDFNFQMNEESFNILRAILVDANIITPSIISVLNGESTGSNNMEVENMFIKMYQCNGIVTDKDLVFQNEETASKELFRRLVDLRVIKSPKINFALARATYVPNFVGGNAWKSSNDPLKRMDDIRKEIEKVVQKVFQLSKTDSKNKANKDFEDKVNTIENIIEMAAGSLRTLPEVKVEIKDLRSMFGDGRVPPELIDFIHMSFDGVLDFKEDKWFDWDCFLCGFIGFAQIVAGVALEISSVGSAHFLAQALISEGVGDIIFSIQAGIEGNFSWQSYKQHKVQSLVLTLVTCGVGSFLSKGAQFTKMGTALALKTAIAKAILKSVFVESCTAVTTALVNVGTEQISKVIIEEMGNIHFIQYFENWTKTNHAFKQKRFAVENQLLNLYTQFGVSVVKQNVKVCLANSMNQVISGALGAKIFAKVSQVISSVTKGFSNAARRLGKCNTKAKILGQIVSIVENAVKVATFSKNFENLCSICNDYYDHLLKELQALERNLSEQQKVGSLNINAEQIAKDKANISFSEEAKKDLAQADENMHTTFKMKVKNGFLQPAVGKLLNLAVQPIQQIITAPFANAMRDLENHIDKRADMRLNEHMKQGEGKIPKITAEQKKALELRNDIIKVDDITNPSWLKAELANFPGQTLESLREAHGPNLHAFVRDGKIFPILPTYKQVCENLKKGDLKCVGNLQIKMAASKENKSIDIVSSDIEGSNLIIHHDMGPGCVAPVGESKSSEDGYKIAFIPGVDGEKGHYCPVVKDEQGNYKVIREISQNAKTEDGCFGQCMLFLKTYETTKNLDEAFKYSEDHKNVEKYYRSMGVSAKHNKYLQKDYLKGITINSNRIIGGLARDRGNNLNRMDRDEINQTNEFNNSSYKIVRNDKDKFYYDDSTKYEEIVTNQIVLIPFGSTGKNTQIKAFRRMSRFLRKKYGKNKHVRIHLASARAGVEGTIDTLFPGSPGMNSTAYHGFEKYYLEIQKNNRVKPGYLILKNKLVFDADATNAIRFANEWHVSIGTTNADVQRQLDAMFTDRDRFKPENRSGRTDYKSVFIDRDNTEGTIQEADDFEYSDSDLLPGFFREE